MTRLNPWGNIRNKSTRGTGKVRSGRAQRGGPPSSYYAMPQTAGGGPADWWIEGQKRSSPTAPDANNAARHNAVISGAFARGGYA